MPGSVHTNNSNSTANDKVSPLIPPPPTNSQPNIIAQPQSPAPSTKSSVFSPKQSNDINKTTQSTPPPPSSSPPQTQQHFSLQPLKKFTHNKIPSISDQSSINSESSPRSFTSMISKNGATERITTTILLILKFKFKSKIQFNTSKTSSTTTTTTSWKIANH